MCLQTAEQVFVSSGCGGLDGLDESCRKRWVTVAQLGQLHRQRGQPATQHLAPVDTELEHGRMCVSDLTKSGDLLSF